MRKMFVIASAAGILAAAMMLDGPPLRAQAPQPALSPVSFSAASIKPNKSGDGRIGIGMQPGGRFTATNVTPAMLLIQAYRLQGGRGFMAAPTSVLVNAPAWLTSDRFDIVATAEANVPPDQFPELVKNLLIERFKLAAHNESREQQVYALMLARSDGKLGPQLKPSATDCAALAAARGRGSAAGAPGGAGPGPGGPGGPGGAAAVARGGP